MFVRVSFIAACLALVVVVLGAYVRLSDAGLGCPDWPGCYGHVHVPQTHTELHAAMQAYPDRPVEAHKAWKEMIHRYFAGTLGLLILALAILALRKRHEPTQLLMLPLVLVGIVIFQALLGMWTVTIKLNPTIVMSHLIGGMATLSLLWWVTLRQSGCIQARLTPTPVATRLPWLALVGLLIVIVQIMLGGWTSSNYAALHCPDFPTCQNQWFPPMDFKEAFTMWRGTDLNFEGGVLDNTARVTIHVMHRLGALITFIYVAMLSFLLWLSADSAGTRRLALVIAGILLLQVCLGISNVLFSLPLAVAVAHNGVGALLLLSMVTLNHALRPVRKG